MGGHQQPPPPQSRDQVRNGGRRRRSHLLGHLDNDDRLLSSVTFPIYFVVDRFFSSLTLFVL